MTLPLNKLSLLLSDILKSKSSITAHELQLRIDHERSKMSEREETSEKTPSISKKCNVSNNDDEYLLVTFLLLHYVRISLGLRFTFSLNARENAHKYVLNKCMCSDFLESILPTSWVAFGKGAEVYLDLPKSFNNCPCDLELFVHDCSGTMLRVKYEFMQSLFITGNPSPIPDIVRVNHGTWIDFCHFNWSVSKRNETFCEKCLKGHTPAQRILKNWNVLKTCEGILSFYSLDLKKCVILYVEGGNYVPSLEMLSTRWLYTLGFIK